MKEELYTIPVNDAFDKECECPICEMYRTLRTNAIEFTMGPSYMEDDVRMQTNAVGFCAEHVRLLYRNQNRLGLALMMLTHTERVIKEIEKRSGSPASGGGLFHRQSAGSPLKQYTDKLSGSCYICSRIDGLFERYVATVFYLYKNDNAFVQKFEHSRGFCTTHYTLLYEVGASYLSGAAYKDFVTCLNQIYMDNLKRVRDDLEWFTDKFDYRNADAPWKNAKDALPRTIQKINGVHPEDL